MRAHTKRSLTCMHTRKDATKCTHLEDAGIKEHKIKGRKKWEAHGRCGGHKRKQNERRKKWRHLEDAVIHALEDSPVYPRAQQLKVGV